MAMVQPGYEGFAALGDVLTGGVKRDAEASYYKGVREGATTAKLLDEARQERSRAMARDALPDAVRASGLAHPELAMAILGMAQGQPNLGTLTSGYQDLAELELQRQQVQAMDAGNIRRANELGAVRTDKNYEPVRELGGAYIPSGVALGDPEFQARPTPKAANAIALGEARRQAVLHPPARPAAASKPAPAAGGALTDAQALAEARQAIAAGADPGAVKKRLRDSGYSKVAAKL
jgi:hypothetical protein